MAVDFKALLGQNLDEVKKPKAIPAGTWFGVVRKHEFALSKEKQTPYVRFTFGLTGPGEDIAPETLDGLEFSTKTLSRTFFITPDAQYRLKEFLESIGIPTSGRTFAETIPEALNKSVMLEVTQRSSQDGSEIYNDVGKVTGVE